MLTNSARRLYKATYAPIQPEEGRIASTGRGVQKAAFVASLAIRRDEIVKLRRQLEASDHVSDMKLLLTLVENMVAEHAPGASMHYAAELSAIPSEQILLLAEWLLQLRKGLATQLEGTIRTLREKYQTFLTAGVTEEPPRQPSTAPAPATSDTLPSVREVQDDAGNTLRITEKRSQVGGSGMLELSLEQLQTLATTVSAPRAPNVTIEEAIIWAEQHEPATYAMLKTQAEQHHSVSLAYTHETIARAITHMIPKVVEAVPYTLGLINGFREQLKVEPVGRLHLERLQFTPVTVERGELVYSLPLTPKETVNISHREWSVSTREFESIVQDSFEGYSEQGVAEKTDIAHSTENQNRHSSALSFNANANASYLGVTLSTTFGYNASSDDAQAQKDSRNHSIDNTRKASSRVKKDHKTSFRVNSVVGHEETSVRTITNPSDSLPMRVDYYQMMRKWQVDLYRYGLRMTYDIAIPSPGSDLIRKLEELAVLDAKRNEPFKFNLKVSDITRDNWPQLASMYQAAIEAPPLAGQSLMASASVQKTPDEKGRLFTGAVEFQIDENYILSSGKVCCAYYYLDVDSEDYSLVFDVRFDGSPQVKNTLFDDYADSKLSNSLFGRSGHIAIPFFHRGVASASINVLYGTTLRPEVFQAWQSRAWEALRAGAEAQYQQRQALYMDQRAELVASLAPFDSLTLRRMEQEEIMKGVMRWLFGPQFQLTPSDIQAILNKMNAHDPLNNDALDPSCLNNQQWQRMMEFGEFIKFVQHAIEWENVLYFTYPYFWDAPKNWTLKQFLDHPDAVHRSFLRAGAARVVLTIRPGFEKSFSELVETGAFGKLPGDHPYITIAEEIQNYAKTNYPGIPPANPADPNHEEVVNEAEKGKLVATWWEYTPTGAMDLSINTPMDQLK